MSAVGRGARYGMAYSYLPLQTYSALYRKLGLGLRGDRRFLAALTSISGLPVTREYLVALARPR
ncbi:hypothetical protein POSPLADRAFT_1038442 [Postia placenta MAD-698-R-SB12]|uniref:Uncharacterized protein n=1 Tax=Postia placenta MAD-698-R-SB12 TaxID=670580 RepID=A0A1X6NBA4_9APHY|nr:hypothetical protein POSPLADRAFT_1038442 [Postia placenta MAD-698-R-SB12]OSX65929.1 hypothetical protein POSPLADRAFT_1038442 [Postia placenta MAD-698-R-SB12]